MPVSHKFLEIVHQRSLKGLPLERVYRQLSNKDLLLTAYGKLYAKPGATTPGPDPQDTVDGMSLQRIETIIEALKAGQYHWKPVRRKEIPKGNGKVRPLGIPSWSDKLLQEAIRMVLEAYYEPRFSPHSHAYRPGRGCHTALQEIQQGWRGVKWFIKIDLRGCFDTIDHNILLDLIFKDIQDTRFRKLLKEMLQAGYMEDWNYHQTYSGVPQGGVVSPILANIMLNELDQFVENQLIAQYQRGQRRRNNPEYDRCGRLINQAQAKGDRKTYRKLVAYRRTLPSQDNFDPNFRRLKYNRYADDILLGFIGPKAEAQAIKTKIQAFLTRLNLEISTEKSQVIHASQKVKYLGYHIHLTQENSKLTRHRQGIKKRSVNSQPTLCVPYEVRKAWSKRCQRQGKVKHRPALVKCSDYELVKTYDLELRGLVNYYALATNVGKLTQVRYQFERSLAKTLAAKHKIPLTKVYHRYNQPGQQTKRCLTVIVPNPNNPDKPLKATFGDMAFRRKKTAILIDPFRPTPFKRNDLVTRLLANECELCGSQQAIEVHHIRALKDIQKKYQGRPLPPRWVISMIERRRKTIVVCHQCHVDIHKGSYDGRKVNPS